MANFLEARAGVVDGLRRELVGPDPQGEPFDPATDTIDEESAWMPRRQAGTGEEILTRDGPDRRYGIAVLYGKGGRARRPEELAAGDGPPDPTKEDDDADVATSGFQEQAAQAQEQLGDEPVSHDLDLSGANEFRPTTMAVTFLTELPIGATLRLELSAGRYQERDITAGRQTRSWWFRSPCALRAEWRADDLRSRAG